MTSKILFRRVVRQEVKRQSWLTVIWLFSFFMLIPFRVLLVMSRAASGEWGILTAKERLFYFSRNVGLGHTENTLFIVAAGILSCLCAFSYVHSAEKTDFYHSLPLKREALLAAKGISSLLGFASAYLSCQLLAVLLGLLFGIGNGEILLEIAAASFQGILYFLCSYAGTLLAVMLTGNIVTTFLALGVIGFYLPMLRVLGNFLGKYFLPSMLAADWGSWEDIFKVSSPWALCLLGQHGRSGLTGSYPTAVELLQVFAAFLVLTGICIGLYRIRRTEMAGCALAFPSTEGAIKLLLAIPSAVTAALIAFLLESSIVWEFLFILLFGALGCMIMEVIYRRDFHCTLKRKWHIAVTVLAASALFFSFRFDVMGYNSYLPKEEELEAMAIKGSWEGFCYEGNEAWRNDSSSYGREFSREILDKLETEHFSGIYRLAESWVKDKNVYEDARTEIAVKFHTKSGKERYRRYLVSEKQYLEVMEDLQRDADFREKYYPILTWDAAELREMAMTYASCGLLSEPEEVQEMEEEWGNVVSRHTYSIPEKEKEAVAEAYRKDLETISYRKLWESEEELLFCRSGWYIAYPLPREMKNTRAVLKQILEKQGSGAG